MARQRFNEINQWYTLELEFSQRAKEEVAITEEELQEALRVGQEYVTKWEQLEAQILEVDRNKSHHHGTSRADDKYKAYHLRRSNPQRYNPEAMAQSKKAAVSLVARQYLSDKWVIMKPYIWENSGKNIFKFISGWESQPRN